MAPVLTPDVRDRAAEAAKIARRDYDNASLYVDEDGRWRYVVDAVTAVVAPALDEERRERRGQR